MIYGYIRVKYRKAKDVKNQKFEIKEFSTRKSLHIDKWVAETVSSTKKIIRKEDLVV